MGVTKFKVIGNHTVDGVEPGKTFEVDENAGRIRWLARAGHIRPVRREPRQSRKPDSKKGD